VLGARAQYLRSGYRTVKVNLKKDCGAVNSWLQDRNFLLWLATESRQMVRNSRFIH
jgi:hypothetical protein